MESETLAPSSFAFTTGCARNYYSGPVMTKEIELDQRIKEMEMKVAMIQRELLDAKKNLKVLKASRKLLNKPEVSLLANLR